jgi:hypothetical protein
MLLFVDPSFHRGVGGDNLPMTEDPGCLDNALPLLGVRLPPSVVRDPAVDVSELSGCLPLDEPMSRWWCTHIFPAQCKRMERRKVNPDPGLE